MENSVKYALISVPMLLLLGACMGGQGAIATQSSYDKWERVSIGKLGFSVEVPKDRRLDRVVANEPFVQNVGFATYDFSLDPIHLGLFEEDRYVIDAVFAVMTPDQYRILCEKGEYNPFSPTFASTIHIFHKSIKEYKIVENEVMGGSAFRRDYLGTHGQVVAISIIRRDYESAEPWRGEDLKAIERILNSVQFQE